ncbi:MAG: acyl-CoA dehydrogenase family protein [Rhodoferax sp.]|uniref:acyl-CoA dehydrogenase family protein n=2 Tax=Rhodoferax sp. TaxID=50421 RepID=UPI0008C884FA|nr:acyl-CoA dehydrogenase family protein [Rhodoferax sp.]MDP2679169.1 acyl-CoA dehydrogenase family protein [Rhodoferax sp.]OGB58923.1 MAG: acyl-CoA dehydrogenase [Burkholderiales bacterium RIFOXYD12_FULL_59_19]OGB78168.1 MAG: acyl-CoA dehydrogenase [Burkholderiales bacterium RIFOXYC12_FULL_60_6]
MNHYHAPGEDIDFILTRVLNAAAHLQALPAFTEVDADLMRQVLDEAGKFVGEVIAPLSRSGDEVGCQFANGQVTTPPGFKAAYQAFWQAGWPALACAQEDGGQGLPGVLEAVLYEMLSGANHGWTMAPGLLHGAYECIKHHASDELKARYLEKVATGEWLATMCLTEPQAGSDLGLVRTKALPQVDSSYRLSGTKIFISGGEHDLSDNIVHLVLARLPDAPPGPKGLSLFLAPKFMPDGSRNPVFCERIEEKMGLHGSATCVMRFDEATGWIVGAPGRGLNAMFVMMNAARLHVGLQGIGLLEAAWQKANAYAQERRQMRAPERGTSAAEADLIIEHPAMRRILDTQRAWIDGGRVLAYKTALKLDVIKHHPDGEDKAEAERWCSLVTPVLKAAWTTQAFNGASDCLQVFGGHGYVREWGIEQIVRDARVAMIYEGTNEIQAIDLLVRKVLPDGGIGLTTLLQQLKRKLDGTQVLHTAVQAQVTTLCELTRQLVQANTSDKALAYWVADDYLRAVALTLLAWAWVQIGQAIEPGTQNTRWSQPATALQHWVLPEFAMRMQIISARLP